MAEVAGSGGVATLTGVKVGKVKVTELKKVLEVRDHDTGLKKALADHLLAANCLAAAQLPEGKGSPVGCTPHGLGPRVEH